MDFGEAEDFLEEVIYDNFELLSLERWQVSASSGVSHLCCCQLGRELRFMERK